MEQAQKMQAEMERIKNEINQRRVTADSGGGMVVVTMTGGGDVTSIKISKEIINPDDIEMLEDLVVAAVNKASQSAKDIANEKMQGIAPFLQNIPGMDLNI